MDNLKQALIENIADILDSEDVQREEILKGLSDPINREESELHIRMAEAALAEYKRTCVFNIQQEAMEDLQAYDEECNKHNSEIINQVVAKVGNKARADFKRLLDFAAVTSKIEIVSKPDGENQNETCGVFTEVWVDQWSVGMDGDSFEGFIYGKFANMEWLKIPYSC